MRCLSDGRKVAEEFNTCSMRGECRAWICRPGCVWLRAVGGEGHGEMLGVLASFARLGGRQEGQREALPLCICQIVQGSMRETEIMSLKYSKTHTRSGCRFCYSGRHGACPFKEQLSISRLPTNGEGWATRLHPRAQKQYIKSHVNNKCTTCEMMPGSESMLCFYFCS